MQTTFWALADSNSSNDPSLKAGGDPSVQITFLPSDTDGNLFLEYNGGNPDPNTLIEINGFAYEFTFELSGFLPTAKKDGAQRVPDHLETSKTYVITVHDYPATGDSTRLFFLEDGTATQADMDAFGKGSISLQSVDTTTNTAVCFASGTLIDTPEGSIPVEKLRAGDMVNTRDDGPQEILWIHKDERWLHSNSEDDKPIQIGAGALGQGLPENDLVLSPHHRVLIGEAGQLDYLTTHSALVPAKALVMLPGIRPMRGKRKVVWVHFALRKHGLVRSEAAVTETLLIGDMVLEKLTKREIARLYEIFGQPQNDEALNGPPARPLMGAEHFRRHLEDTFEMTDLKRSVREQRQGSLRILASAA